MKNSDLQLKLDEACRIVGIVGASAGILYKGEAAFAASGVLNRNTGVEATLDSCFQIGSISKVFTTAIAMTLVDEGRLELDSTLAELLPAFQCADPRAKEITIADLAGHTSGLAGDFFRDSGRGEDCLARFVDQCALLPMLHAPGQEISYCNSGFVLLGRVLEVITGRTWDELISTRIFGPAGMKRAFTQPEDSIKYRTAIGHLPVPGAGAELHVAPSTHLPRSMGPAGATATMDIQSLMAFGSMMLHDGVGDDGTRVLSADSVARMKTPRHVFDSFPDMGVTACGQGWFVVDWGRPGIMHGGTTLGQGSFLGIFPDDDLVIGLLSNGGSKEKLINQLFGPIISESIGATYPELPKVEPESEIDFSRYEGIFRHLGPQRWEVRADDKGNLLAHVMPGEFDAGKALCLKPTDRPDMFLIHVAALEEQWTAKFLTIEDAQKPDALRAGMRIYRRESVLDAM